MICIPLKYKSTAALLKKIKEANQLADIIEIWLDEIVLTEDSTNRILGGLKKDLLYKYMGNEANLELLLKYKVKYIDLDLAQPKSLIKKIRTVSPQTQIILSHHDFSATPSSARLGKIVSQMKAKGADIVKLATTAKDFSDTLRMLAFLNDITKQRTKAICLCMGREGKLTRAAGHLIGNYLMYASISLKDKTASGQIPVKELRELRNLL